MSGNNKTLSDKITNAEKEYTGKFPSGVTDFCWAEDVKEFIKELKAEIDELKKYSQWVDMVKDEKMGDETGYRKRVIVIDGQVRQFMDWCEEIINKLAGEKLI